MEEKDRVHLDAVKRACLAGSDPVQDIMQNSAFVGVVVVPGRIFTQSSCMAKLGF